MCSVLLAWSFDVDFDGECSGQTSGVDGTNRAKASTMGLYET